MSHPTVELSTLELFQKQQFEELKQRYAEETRKLRKQKVLLGLGAVAFITAFAVTNGLLT